MPVIVIACLYVLVGVGGLIAHFKDLGGPDGSEIAITEGLAIVCVIILLRAKNWARWLAGAWMAFHVVISVGVLRQLAVHCPFLVLIAWCLFRPGSARYFKSAASRM